MEEDEQWKQLESSGKHVKHQYIFGEIIKKAEIAWSDRPEKDPVRYC